LLRNFGPRLALGFIPVSAFELPIPPFGLTAAGNWYIDFIVE